MNFILGIIILTSSFHVLAESRSTFLQLRAIVPERTTVRFGVNEKGPTARIETNAASKSPGLTKVDMKKILNKNSENFYLVSVTHP